jgi:sphinganine-1-phosphate aldolase
VIQLLSANAIDKLLEDLRTVINQVKSEPPSKDGTMVALYGLGQTSVGKPVVPLLAEMFIDTLYMTRPGVVEEESE